MAWMTREEAGAKASPKKSTGWTERSKIQPVEDYQPTAQELEAAGRDPEFAGVPGGKPTPKAEQKPQVPKWVNNDFITPPDTPQRTIEKAARGSLYNVPTQIMKTGSAINERAASAVELASGGLVSADRRRESNRRMQETFPSDTADGTVEGIIQTTLESLPGLAVGGALGKAVFASLPANAPLYAKALKAGASSVAGDAVAGFFTMNPNERKVLMGKDSMFRTGWGYNEETGDLNQDVFNRKLNMAMDEMILGAGVTGAISGIIGLFNAIPRKMVGGASLPFRKGAQENKVVSQFLDIIGNIKPEDPPKIAEAKRVAARNLVANNKDAFFELGSLDEGLEGIDRKRFTNTIGIVTDQLRKRAKELPPGFEQNKFFEQIKRLEEVVAAHKGSRMDATLDIAERQADDILSEAEESALSNRVFREELQPSGEVGMTPVQRGGKQMVSELEGQIVRPAEEGVTKSSEELFAARKQISDAITNDPTFSNSVQAVSDIDTEDIVIGKVEEISNVLLERAKKLLTKKQELYERIPRGKNYGDSEHVQNVIQDLGVSLPDDIKKAVESAGKDIHKMDEVASFQISRAIGEARGSNSIKTAEALVRLKEALTKDQFEILSKKTEQFKGGKQKEFLQTITEARDFFKNDIAPWRNSDALSSIMDATSTFPERQLAQAKSAVGETAGKAYQPRGLGQPYDLRSIIEQVQKESAENSTVDPNLVKDWGALNIQERLINIMQSKGEITPEAVSGLISEVRANRELIGVEAAKRIEKTISDVLQGNIKNKNAEAALDQAYKNLDSAKERLYSEILKDYSANSPENAAQGFDSLFKSSDVNSENLIDIIRRTDNNPIVNQAIRGSYFNHLRKRLKDSPDTLVKSFNDPNSGTSLVIKELYGDKGAKVLSDIMKSVEQNQLLKTAKQNAQISTTAIGQLGLKAINGIQTWLLGILNPTAARVKTITNDLVANADSPRYVREVLDKILSDPEDFLRIADVVLEKERVTAIPQLRNWVRRAVERGVVYGGDNTEEREFLSSQEQDDTALSNQTDTMLEEEESGNSTPEKK